MSGRDDPFNTVKFDVVQSLKEANGYFDRWKELLETTNTSGNEEFEWTFSELKQTLTSIDDDLQDLARTIVVVENNRAGYRLDDAELQARRDFVANTRKAVQEIRRTLESADTKSKIERDTRNSLMRKPSVGGGGGGGGGGAGHTAAGAGGASYDRYAKLDDSHVRENDEIIRDTHVQQQAMIAQQDEDLGQVSQTVGVLKNMAKDINKELKDQSQMLDEMDNKVDDTRGNLGRVMKRLDVLNKSVKDKKSVCCIVLLIVVLVILLCVTLAIKT